MPDFYLEKCKELASGATTFYDRPNGDDWKRLEREIGIEFPDTHKEFVSIFGSGAFGDFGALNPIGREAFLLSKASLSHMRRNWLALSDLGVPVYPDAGGLVIVANTGSNRCYALRQARGALSENLIELNLGAHNVADFRMGIAEFVYKAYTGELGDSIRESIWGGFSEFFETVET